MKKIRKTRLMTLVYMAPILLALGACMSGSGTSGQNSCNGSSSTPDCRTGSHVSSDGKGCCGNGVSC